MKMFRPMLIALALAAACATTAAHAQRITTPPDGDNQRASVIQGIGLVEVRVDYSSPDVHGPQGEDRKGHIWGELVPYGLSDLGFNDCKECPWRAGANENTVFSVTHDVTIEGQPLKAGRYGLHMIPGKDEWTIIFSRNAHSWGSYFYDPSEDALRVKVKPVKSEYREWLSYGFTNRMPDHATCVLQWEEMAIPFEIKVPDISELYVAQITRELEGGGGFRWNDLNQAAQYCLQNKVHPELALAWADKAVNMPFVGQPNATTLGTLCQAQFAAGKQAEGLATLDRMLAQSGQAPGPLHMFGRQLQMAGNKDAAMRVYQANARMNAGKWPVAIGLARGHDMMGETKKALAFAKVALAQAPDEPNRKNVQTYVTTLEKKLAGK